MLNIGTARSMSRRELRITTKLNGYHWCDEFVNDGSNCHGRINMASRNAAKDLDTDHNDETEG